MDNWVFEDNLEQFIAVLAYLVGYRMYSKEHDWVGIESGLQSTNVDNDRWYSYPFAGTVPVLLEVSHDPNATEVANVRVRSTPDVTPELKAKLDLLVFVCQEYHLST
jgi:hypothetical protein